jgi:hypothetical protein
LRIAAQALNAAALTFFTWLSSRKDPNRTAVFAFNAKKYEKPETDGDEKRPVVFVSSLTREEVGKVCDKLPDVQKLTDAAVANVKRVGDYKGPADFGTKVHKEIAKAIRKENDPNFKAEQSVIKTLLETGRKTSTSNSGNAQEVAPKMEADYGELGSIRIDAYENVPEKSAVCVYDPKTGWRGLSFPRMNELAAATHRLSDTIIGARPSLGSSTRSRRGAPMSTRAKREHLCSPPDNVVPCCRRRSRRQGKRR